MGHVWFRRRWGIAFRPSPLLSTAHFAMRREGAALNCSLTIIVLTPLTTFSCRAFARGWKTSGKYMNWLGYFNRDVGSSKGPPQARKDFTRAIAMPCADRLRWESRPRANAHFRAVAPGARRLRIAAGFAAAQNRREDRGFLQRRQAPRQRRARAVADRQDSDLWHFRRQRRLRLRLRLAQSHAQEAEALFGSGPTGTPARARPN